MSIQKRFSIGYFLLSVILFFACMPFCSGDIQSLAPAKDTFIDEINAYINNGTSPYLILRRASLSGWAIESLIQFDLGGIPAGTNVKSAKLNLYYFHYNDGDPVGNPLEIRRLIQNWGESTVTWNNQPLYDGTTATTTAAPPAFGWVQWDVTGDVQAFVDGEETNYGWLIRDVSSESSSMVYHYSREWSEAQYRPFLQVDLDNEPCGGNGYHPGDFNHDCVVNLGDFLILAQSWLSCSNAADPSCTTPAQNKIVGAGFAFDSESTGPAKILFLYDNMNAGQLQEEDEIVEYNNVPVSSGAELNSLIGTMPDPPAGSSMPMNVIRAGVMNNVTVQVNYIRRVDFRQYLHPYRYTKVNNADCATSYLANGKRYCYCKTPAADKVCYEKNVYYLDPGNPTAYLIISECFDVYTNNSTTINNPCYSFNPDEAQILPGNMRRLTGIIGK